MAEAAKRVFTLPAEESGYVEELVRSGVYASATEVVRAGLRALRERDAEIERWLREDVGPVYDAMIADPGRGISPDDVVAEIRARAARDDAG